MCGIRKAGKSVSLFPSLLELKTLSSIAWKNESVHLDIFSMEMALIFIFLKGFQNYSDIFYFKP